MPQPVRTDEAADPFAALGVARSFRIELAPLEKRFYALSRALHPDRFPGKGAVAVQRSVERMSLVNQAYRTLKDVGLRREALLALEGFPTSGGKMPMELAESWFDLQDALAEGTESSRFKLQAFETELHEFQEVREARLRSLEDRWEADRAPGALQALATEVGVGAYLKSLERDVVRIRERLRGQAS